MREQGSGLFDEALSARRRLRKWAAVAVAVLVVVRFGAEVAPTMRRPDLALLDFWQSLRGTDRPSPQVVIVAIDEKSIDRLGPTAWPRNEYVPLIERLSRAGARVIGFDFTFGRLEREAANNDLLAEAMKKAGNVVFGYEFTHVGDPSPAATPPSAGLRATALPEFESPAIPNAPSLIEPEPVLTRSAAAIGHVTTVAGEDGRIRVVPLFIQHNEKAYPSLALQIARVYTKTPMGQVALESGVVRMGSFSIPVSASGELLLDWPAAGERAFRQYSFLDVVRGDVPDQAFSGKAVLVAGTAPGLDDRDLPFAVEAPGVLIYATFLDNVFRSDFLRAPTWAFLLEWGLFFALCGLGVWLLPRLSTPILLIGVPGLAVLLLAAAAFLFVQNGVWLQVVYPTLALLVPLGSTVALRLTASERETRDVAAEKIESQKLLALSFQEKGMLDMALATFDRLPFGQEMRHVYLNLALDYENRGQRDKAFLVYQKIFDADPGFGDVAARMERLGQTGAGESMLPMPSVVTGLDPDEDTTELSADVTSLPTESGRASLAGEPPITGSGPQSPRITGSGPQRSVAGVPRITGSGPQRSVAGVPRITGSGPFRSMPSVGPATPSSSGGPIPQGTRFSRYEIEKHLGRGAMGDVYLVRDVVINRMAALKTIRGDTGLEARQVIEMRQRFYREAQIAGRLAHPNIVTVYDVGEELGMSYIVMEFVEGNTLTQLIKKQRLSFAQIKHVVFHVAIGLDFAHQNGVFHRDVKPDNIMVSKTDLVKVMDFGIARIVDSDLTKAGSVIGTPTYMSPEQFSGKQIDARSDIFSLGVILYELLTGKRPFSGDTMSSLMYSIMTTDPTRPSAMDGKIHTAWDEILRRALAKEPDARYATAMEFAEAVRDVPVR